MVGEFLERQARTGQLISYAQVVAHFPDLPPLTEAWLGHPLCKIFGELDDEDGHSARPFRTALVISKEAGMPEQGFFETAQKLRWKQIRKSDHPKFWVDEVRAVLEYYK